MIELGIIPSVTQDELYQMLQGMSSSDRRKLNRKFRKVWRKIAKSDKEIGKYLGLGDKDPQAHQIKRRAAVVVSRISRLVDATEESGLQVPLQPW
jgi:hypothetical protein